MTNIRMREALRSVTSDAGQIAIGQSSQGHVSISYSSKTIPLLSGAVNLYRWNVILEGRRLGRVEGNRHQARRTVIISLAERPLRGAK